VEALKLLVAKGANPHAEFITGWSPVMAAVDSGSVEALQALLAMDLKINLSKTTSDGFTPVMLAASQGHVTIIAVLAAQHVDLNQTTSKGKTALHLAVEKNQLEVVKALVLSGAAVDLEDNDGNTPLHLAAKRNKRKIFDFLIAHGASKEKVNNAGNTPFSPGFSGGDVLNASTALNSMLNKIAGLAGRLPAADAQAVLERLKQDLEKSYHKSSFSGLYSGLPAEVGLTFVAAENDNVAALRLLLAEDKIAVEAKARDDWSPLHVAVINGSKNMVYFLLGEGVDPSCKVKSTGNTAAFLAAAGGYTDILRKIIAQQPPELLNRANAKDQTPLFAAVRNGHAAAVQALIEAKVDVNRAPDHEWSPLHLSIKQNHFKIFELLVEKADLNRVMFGTQMTPVALAAEDGRSDHLRVLIGKAPPVDLRMKNADERTPLMLAIRRRHATAAKMLIAALDAKDLNAQDYNGETALHMAIANNDLELVEALITKGADVNLATRYGGSTPIQLAVQGHQVQIANFLLSKHADPEKEDFQRQSALSRGTPLADALERRNDLFSAIERLRTEFLHAPPSHLFPELDFARLIGAIERDTRANYESFVSQYDSRLFGNNDYSLLAFIAVAKGYKNLLELLLPKIDISVKNPAGLSLFEVAEAYPASSCLRILHDYEGRIEQKRPDRLPVMGLFSSKHSALPPSLTPKPSASTDPFYVQLREKILEEAKRIKEEIRTQPGFNPSRHRKTLKYLEIQKKLAECELVARKQADQYHYLKSQCEDKSSPLHRALRIKTGMGAEAAGSASKNVFDKIAELDAQRAARDLRPDA